MSSSQFSSQFLTPCATSEVHEATCLRRLAAIFFFWPGSTRQRLSRARFLLAPCLRRSPTSPWTPSPTAPFTRRAAKIPEGQAQCLVSRREQTQEVCAEALLLEGVPWKSFYNGATIDRSGKTNCNVAVDIVCITIAHRNLAVYFNSAKIPASRAPT